MRISHLLPLLLISLFFLDSVSAIQFFLKQGEEICLSEDVLNGELLIGDFSVSPTDGRVSCTVSDASGTVVYSKSVNSDGKFAHTANKAGEYKMCFHNSGKWRCKYS